MIKKIKHAIRKKQSEIREERKAKTRSSEWAKIRDRFIDDNPFCAACGSHNDLQVHHVKPFHLHPELELDPANLITLCMDVNDCHLNIGHGDSFKTYNPNVREDAGKFLSATDDVRKIIVELARKNRLT